MVEDTAPVSTMARRAILTDTERQYLRGELDDVDSNRGGTMDWRIGKKVERFEEDYELLREHRPERAKHIHGIVCEEDLDQRVERLERELRDLRGEADV